MDLFVVNRYNGDEKPDASDEKSKLDKVLKKIKKRKLAREKRRHEENLKVNKVSKFKVEKNKKNKIKRKLKVRTTESENKAKKSSEGDQSEEPSEKKNNKKKAVKLGQTENKTKRKKNKKEAEVDAKKSKEDELNEEKIEELTAEQIAEKLLQKQLKNFNKSNEVSEEQEDATETKKIKKKKKKQVAETENKAIEEQDTDGEEPKSKKKKLNPDDVEGFTILGVDKFAKRKTVKRVLPKWLRNPTVISSDLNNLNQKISRTDLNTQLKQKLKEKQIKYLFPVQAEFIPWQLKVSKINGLIAPPDACISAPTGSGKTLAFTIPILQSLLQQLENRCLTIKAIRALIILPTQSLAVQIYDTFKSLISGSDLNVGLATGAGNRPLEAEQNQLITYNSIWGASSKVDILVCTAGRLVDHLKSTKGFDLKHLQFIIIDEADRVLDSIQDDWLYHLGIHLREDSSGNFINRNVVNVESVKHKTDPQKLLFSATLSQDPEKLQKLSLFQPKLFTCISENDVTEDSERFIGKYTTPAELTEKYIICTIDIKPLILYKLIIDEIDKNRNARILVFVNTVETLHRLNVLLKYMGQEKFTVAEFSSNQGNLKARQSLLKKFEDGLVQVLVCTDSMARGIDIPNVDCVISYSVPNHLKTYIHRAGRTARAGTTGLCISMMHAKQQKTFLSMIENMRSQTKNIAEISVPSEDLEILTPLYEQCLVQLKEKVSDEIEKSALRIKTKKLAFNNKKKNRKLRRKLMKKAT